MTRSPARVPVPLYLLILYFCSGLATLVYEVVWLRQLAGDLSNSSHALSLVLAGFLLGLACGARFMSRRLLRVRLPVRAYARTELLVALLAGANPWLLKAASQATWSGCSPGLAHALRLLSCGLLMFVATLPIGATFPLQVRTFRPTPERATRAAAFLLGFQTAGGMTGVFLAGFVLLPALGLHRTHQMAVAITVLVSLAAYVLARNEQPIESEEEDRVDGGPAPERRFETAALLTATFVVGGASLGLEVLYTRVLTFFLPDLAYSFSAMLVVYLLAIAVGCLLAHPLARGLQATARLGWFALVGALAVVGSLAVIPALHGILHAFEAPGGGFERGSFAAAAFLGSLALVAVPAALLASFLPLCIGRLAQRRGVSRSAGLAYAVNSLGSASGALLAGLVLVPWVGVKGGVACIGLVVGACGVLLVAAGSSRGRAALAAVAAALSLAALLWTAADLERPLIEDSWVFRSSRQVRAVAEDPAAARRLVEVREGAVTVASVIEQEGRRLLFNDAFQAAGTGAIYQYMKLLGHLPMLLCAAPRDVLVIAFGTGTTAGSVSLHDELRHLTLVEISPEVLELAPYFEAVNFGLPARSPAGATLDVVVDDGRAFLRRARDPFDVITLEPLFPATPAAIHFYTREFFALARANLRDGGVLCHWVPVHAQPPRATRAILATFAAVFEDSEVYLHGTNAVLLGWRGKRPALDSERLEARFLQPRVAQDLSAAGFPGVGELLGHYITSGATLRARTEELSWVTDDRPSILYGAVRPKIEHLMYDALGRRELMELAEPGPPGWEALPPALRELVGLAQQDLVARHLEQAEQSAARYSLWKEASLGE